METIINETVETLEQAEKALEIKLEAIRAAKAALLGGGKTGKRHYRAGHKPGRPKGFSPKKAKEAAKEKAKKAAKPVSLPSVEPSKAV